MAEMAEVADMASLPSDPEGDYPEGEKSTDGTPYTEGEEHRSSERSRQISERSREVSARARRELGRSRRDLAPEQLKRRRAEMEQLVEYPPLPLPCPYP